MRRYLYTALLLLPALLEAHTGHAPVDGLVSGLLHPIHGLDHLLAMLAVGLWAGVLGGRARWLLPAVFPAVMLLGAACATLALPAVELGIAASVLVLGLLVAGRVGASLWLAAPLVAGFAFLHGHAHGGELPLAANPWLYGLGFTLTTIALHLVGMALAGASTSPNGRLVLRGGGAAIAACGLVLMLI